MSKSYPTAHWWEMEIFDEIGSFLFFLLEATVFDLGGLFLVWETIWQNDLESLFFDIKINDL